MEKILEKIKNLSNSKTWTIILCSLGSLIIILLVFSFGVHVGFRKASFGRAWGENYERNFGMRPNMPFLGKDNFPNSNGAIGKIIKKDSSNIIIEGKDGKEKVLTTTDKTKVEKGSETIDVSQLNVDDFLVVIGTPNDQGQIEAKFIRVVPSPDLMQGNMKNTFNNKNK